MLAEFVGDFHFFDWLCMCVRGLAVAAPGTGPGAKPVKDDMTVLHWGGNAGW